MSELYRLETKRTRRTRWIQGLRRYEEKCGEKELRSCITRYTVSLRGQKKEEVKNEMNKGLKKDEEKVMKREFDRLEKERKNIEEGETKMKIVSKSEVQLSKRGKNDYDRLSKDVKKSVGEKKVWIVEVQEAEVYRILGSKTRKHLSSKYGLGIQVGKELSESFKTRIYCKFTSTKKVFYISNHRLS